MEFYGILGEKLGHSLSPRIHKMIFETIGVEGAYKLFEVPKDKLELFTDAMKVLGIKGSNVTIPYKEKVMDYLDFVSKEAEDIGAVNTIVLENGKLYGYNTDYYGFGYMLTIHNVETKDSIAVILGSGGASKAALHYLLDAGCRKVYVVTRDVPKCKKLCNRKVEYISYEGLERIKGDIIINTTPIGMFPNDDQCPISDEIINNFDTIVDIIYNPTKTKLLLHGEKLQKKVVGGLYMLIGQGVRAEELWQKRTIDETVIKDIYEVLNREFS